MIHINDIKFRENTEYFFYQVTMVIERGRCSIEEIHVVQDRVTFYYSEDKTISRFMFPCFVLNEHRTRMLQ